MESEKVKFAPKAVIDELDNVLPTINPYTVLDLFLGGSQSSETKHWYNSQQKKFSHADIQLAIINHVFNNERLQLECEPRYIVTDGGGNFYLEDGSLYVDSAENHDARDYQGQGMTKEQASGLVNLFGGEVVEIPEREPRYYVVDEDNCYVRPVYIEDLGATYVHCLPDTSVPEEELLLREDAERIAKAVGGTIEEIK